MSSVYMTLCNDRDTGVVVRYRGKNEGACQPSRGNTSDAVLSPLSLWESQEMRASRAQSRGQHAVYMA